MECEPRRMCELLVGLGEVDLVGIDEGGEGTPLVVTIRSGKPRSVCVVLWGAGVVQGSSDGGVGGFAGVRSCGSVGVAETPLDMSEH